MGKASREKRERKELPEHLQFGPEFIEPEVIIGVGLATATSGAMVSGPTEEEAE